MNNNPKNEQEKNTINEDFDFLIRAKESKKVYPHRYPHPDSGVKYPLV
jgi:hypothetical protein